MEHFLKVNGVIAAQTPKIENAFKSILENFNLIIEIGFDRGALTSWLYQNKNKNTKLVSYDISFDRKEIQDNSIDFRQGNCFDENIVNEIKTLIETSDKTLILCDGGSKELEFDLYSKFLKSGDVIMLHDYAHDDVDYNVICSKLNWKSPAESRFTNIQTAIDVNNLVPYEYDLFKSVLWGSFIKK